MGATLDALHTLQEIELQIAELQRTIDRKKTACHRQQKKIDEIEARIKTHRDQRKMLQMDYDRNDLTVKSNEAEITKYRQALNLAKTNKEYSAVLTQLNTFKADTGKLEEKGLELLGQIDVKEKEIAALEAEKQTEQARLKELYAAVEDAEHRASDRMNRLKKEREAAAAAVPDQVRDMFNRVARKNEGEAMASIVRTHPKRQEYACEGCNMSITIEQVNSVLSRDEAVLCNVCGRILYAGSGMTSAR